MFFGAMNFPVNPVLEEIEIFARLGFDYLELAMDPPMAHHQVIAGQRTAIVKSLEKHNLGLVCHLPTFLSTADLADTIRQASLAEMLQSLEVAAILGAKKVVLHPSMVFGMGGFVLETVKEHALAFVSTMVSAAQRLNITICLENMMPRNMLGVEPDYFVEIFREFPSLALTLDTGHANMGDPGGHRLKQLVTRFGDRLGHVHVSDNQGVYDDHLPVGSGTVNFSAFIHALKKSGYDETITLEVFVDNRQMLLDSRDRLQNLLRQP
jgi:sugar phosphate isomerase/epimerase